MALLDNTNQEPSGFDKWLQSPGAMALAASLLKSSGPQAQPTSLGQAIGVGMEDMSKANSQEAQRKLLDLQGTRLGQEIAQQKESIEQRKSLNSFFQRMTGMTPPTSSTTQAPSVGAPSSMPQSAATLPQMAPTVQAPGASPIGGTAGATPTAPNTGNELPTIRDPLKLAAAQMMFTSGNVEKAIELLYGKQEPYTLGEGQTRFDNNNRPVAAGSPKDNFTQLERNARASGYTPGTPEHADFIRKNVLRERTTINQNIPTGFMLDPNDTGKILPIPGGPAERTSPQEAGYIQMQRNAKNLISTVDNLTFNQDGSPNYKNITNAGLNTVYTDGRRLRTAMEAGIQAITRLETGAAMPESEVENTRTRFMPKAGDDSATVKLKIKMYKEFIGGSLKLIDPSGRFDTERYESEFNNRISGVESQKNPKTANTPASKLSDAELKQYLGIG